MLNSNLIYARAALAASCNAIPVESKIVISSADVRPGFLPQTIGLT